MSSLQRELAPLHQAGFAPDTARLASFGLGILDGVELTKIALTDEHIGDIGERLSNLNL